MVDVVFFVLMFVPFSNFSDMIFKKFYTEKGKLSPMEKNTRKSRLTQSSNSKESGSKSMREKENQDYIKYHDVFALDGFGYEKKNNLIENNFTRLKNSINYY